MRRVSSYGGNYGLPGSQRLKYNLSATSGMHLLSAVHENEEHGMFSPSHSGSQVLHSTSWATRNFQFTMASLHGKPSIARSSSCSIYFNPQGPAESTMYEVSGVEETVPVLEASDYRSTESSSEVATQTLPSFEDSATTLVEDSDETGAREAFSVDEDHISVGTNLSSGQVSLDEAATKIQALYKGFAARVQYMLGKNSAIRIQAALRRWIIRKQYTNLCNTTRKIQRFYQVRRSKEKRILSSATAIQAHARGFLVRHMVKQWNTAACCIQRCWKLHLASSKRGHQAAAQIQRQWRVSLDEAATKIQALYKGFAARGQYMLRKNSAIRIQAALRRWIIRKQYTNLCKATRKVQRFYQARRSTDLLQKRILSRKTSSATAIQAHARGFLVRHMVHRWNTAACCIQRCWKMHLASSKRGNQAAAQIQRQWRCFKAKVVHPREIANVVVATNQEDWNTVQVEHLDHCLDTCLATLHPQMPSQHVALDIPESFTSSSHASSSPKDNTCLEQMHSDYTDELIVHNHRHKVLNEKRLQQVARVFLLQHHIALQQQRAKFAPPFPPKYQMEVIKDTYRKNTQNQNNPSNVNCVSGEALPHSETGDIILDVQYLLKEAAKLGAVSPVLYMQNDAVIDIKIEGTRNQDLVGFKQINALLVVFVAVVIYTKTICQGVMLWARQPARK